MGVGMLELAGIPEIVFWRSAGVPQKKRRSYPNA
jgi:hypothetical protein